MNEIRRVTFTDRIRNAVRAFKGSNVKAIHFGLDVKRCDECEFKQNTDLRDDLLVTAGLKAARLEHFGLVKLPDGFDGERMLVVFLINQVERYILVKDEAPFGDFIERSLYEKYGVEQANDKLKTRGYLFLNEVLDMVGIPRCKAGQVVGWIYNKEKPIGDNFVSFGLEDTRRVGVEGATVLNFNVDGNILDYI